MPIFGQPQTDSTSIMPGPTGVTMAQAQQAAPAAPTPQGDAMSAAMGGAQQPSPPSQADQQAAAQAQAAQTAVLNNQIMSGEKSLEEAAGMRKWKPHTFKSGPGMPGITPENMAAATKLNEDERQNVQGSAFLTLAQKLNWDPQTATSMAIMHHLQDNPSVADYIQSKGFQGYQQPTAAQPAAPAQAAPATQPAQAPAQPAGQTPATQAPAGQAPAQPIQKEPGIITIPNPDNQGVHPLMPNTGKKVPPNVFGTVMPNGDLRMTVPQFQTLQALISYTQAQDPNSPQGAIGKAVVGHYLGKVSADGVQDVVRQVTGADDEKTLTDAYNKLFVNHFQDWTYEQAGGKSDIAAQKLKPFGQLSDQAAWKARAEVPNQPGFTVPGAFDQGQPPAAAEKPAAEAAPQMDEKARYLQYLDQERARIYSNPVLAKSKVAQEELKRIEDQMAFYSRGEFAPPKQAGAGFGSVQKQKMAFGDLSTPEGQKNANMVQARVDKLFDDGKIDESTKDDWASQNQMGRAYWVADELTKRGFAGASLAGTIAPAVTKAGLTSEAHVMGANTPGAIEAKSKGAAAVAEAGALGRNTPKVVGAEVGAATAKQSAKLNQTKVENANSAQVALNHAKNPDGTFDPKKVTPQTVEELAVAVAKMFSTTGTLSDSERKAFHTNTMNENIARAGQYLGITKLAGTTEANLEALQGQIKREAERSQQSLDQAGTGKAAGYMGSGAEQPAGIAGKAKAAGTVKKDVNYYLQKHGVGAQ